MKKRQLQESLAQVSGFKPATVTVTLRALREAGLITAGKRGRSSPDFSTRDIASALAALLTAETPGVRGHEAYNLTAPLQCSDPNPDPHGFSLEALRGLEYPYTFLDALTALIDVFVHDREARPFIANSTPMRDGSLRPPRCFVMVSHTPEPFAEIHMGPTDEEAASLYMFAGPSRLLTDALGFDHRLSPVCTRSSWIEEGAVKALADDFIQAKLENGT